MGAVFVWAKMPSPAVKDAFCLREEVFVKEQGFQNEFDKTDESCLHLICYEGERVAGCARLFCQGAGVWHAGRIAVAKDCRGAGMGAAIMAALEQKAAKLGGKKLILSAQRRAAGFYEKQGYERVGEEYLDEYCPHVDMEKVLDKGRL